MAINTPKPISRDERYLSKIGGNEEVIVPKPVSREEKYMYRVAGYDDQPIPDYPIGRNEKYWAKIVENGGGSSTLIEKSITENGVYNASDDEADGYSSVTADVPNTYTAGDEGKVVDNGALVAQTAKAESITVNGTYDTTKNNSVTVDVVGENNAKVEKIPQENGFSIDKSLTEITIPSGYEVITSLSGCKYLKKVTIPNTINAFSNNAFAYCSALAKIEVPSAVTVIANFAFRDCTSLSEVVFKNGSELQIIGAGCFQNCTALTSIELPSTVTTINNSSDNPAFKGCTNLQTITINKPEGSISGAPWGAKNAQVIWTG